jgi:glycolate oxidase FAD binding subunit
MLLAPDMRPAFEKDAAQMLAEASHTGQAVELVGSGSKREIGRPSNTTHTLSTRAMKGITLYEPAEMVMSARAGTPVSEILLLLAKNNQMLACEPSEFAGPLATDASEATIGALFATNASGARRILAGAARDHLIGVRAATGKGELIKSGGRVMKNVTGYDVARGLAGSWGTLALLTEVTFKVVPTPTETATLVLLGLFDEIAVEVLCAAMGTPFEVSGAVHLQKDVALSLAHEGIRGQGKSVTAIRIENVPHSVAYRTEKLKALLAPYGTVEVLNNDNSLAFWDELRRLSFLRTAGTQLWRVSTAPQNGPQIAAAVQRYVESRAYFDWSGGLVWLEVAPTSDAAAADIRRVMASFGGHATLMRAEPSVRAAIDVFQPLDPGLLALTRRIKSTFDPAGVLNPGRLSTVF